MTAAVAGFSLGLLAGAAIAAIAVGIILGGDD